MRSFTDDDVRVVEFLRDVASLIPEGGTGVKRTVLLAAVARCLTADRSLLDEELVYIAFDGSVHLTPVTGWCLVRSTSPP